MFQHINIQKLNELMEGSQPLHILDIRDPQSYATGHITGAKPLDNSNVQTFIENTKKEDCVVVCCYHGNSSQGAAQFLGEQGFTNAHSLDGGFEMWKLAKPEKIEPQN
ncbi:thiosulfate sulfurtransferase GlpE [Oceaniserpentilla sp. 4NH20-0058]|uniref:thiosulfate sulfurtransferase GlpE n=1 Tax=Oceaniserpentilla sp. 4NH20-0058 TaxID=3127660 RepID=UPI003108A16C